MPEMKGGLGFLQARSRQLMTGSFGKKDGISLIQHSLIIDALPQEQNSARQSMFSPHPSPYSI